jgi:hypothetical protein
MDQDAKDALGRYARGELGLSRETVADIRDFFLREYKARKPDADISETSELYLRAKTLAVVLVGGWEQGIRDLVVRSLESVPASASEAS